MDSKIYNTLNQLCNRLATLENKVNKGITVEGGNSSEILKLGDTLRFNSSGGLQTTVSPGSVNVSHNTLNIAHCADSDPIDPTFINIECGIRRALGMPYPHTLVSFGQADALWFNQQDKNLWLFLWFNNEVMMNKDDTLRVVNSTMDSDKYKNSDGTLLSNVEVSIGHYDVFLINDKKGSGIKPGPIFPIININLSGIIRNYIDVPSLKLNEFNSDRSTNITNLGGNSTYFWEDYSVFIMETNASAYFFPSFDCNTAATLYGQNPAKCTT